MATQTQAPVEPGSENKLYILQQGIVEDAPGGVPAHLSFGILSTVPDPVNPGDITISLKAPTGFAFTSWLSWAYHDVNTLQAKGNMNTTQGTLGDGGRTLTFTQNPYLASNQEALGYAAQVTAVDGATPGRYTDGQLKVGAASPIKLKGRVLDANED
ncbi:hypothetical protein AB0M29_31270 [Streptomyces sp. NPDC051976]|uniref:hypothetical protein n=1 Tax=Streptomyces sp. NPDC051976 TaxID=3154947 RepID=UPI003433085D